LLLAAGVAGVIGVFLPMVQLSRGPLVVGYTATDLSFGLEKTHAVANKRLPRFVAKRMTRVVDTQSDLRDVLDAAKWAAAAFVPGILLGLFGAIGVARRRVGRVLGALSLVLGAASLAAWFGLRYAMQYAAEEADLGKIHVDLQIGAHALLAIGMIGVIAALGALISPDTGDPTRPGRTARELRPEAHTPS
jgi:hypothetical protein